MRLNIFLLLYFFVAIFTIGIADRGEPYHCRSRQNLVNAFPSSKRLVQTQNNRNDEKWSRFIDGQYAIVGRDPVVVWINILSKEALMIEYKVLASHAWKIYFEPFGIKECRQILELKKETIKLNNNYYYELKTAKCGCDPFIKGDQLFIPMKLWTDVDVIKLSFQQKMSRTSRAKKLDIYLSEEEDEEWSGLPMCPNKKYMLREQKRFEDGDRIVWSARLVSELKREFFNGKEPFYVINDIDYVDLYKRDTALYLEMKNENSWTAKLDLVIQLQRGKALHQDVEIKVEVNGEAPVKDFELFEDGTGLKIHIQHRHCLQAWLLLGCVRYVIRVSEPDLLSVSFMKDGSNWPIIVSEETIGIYQDLIAEASSNNDFTTYLLKYTPPTFPPTRPPKVAPTIPPAPVTNLPPSFSSTRSIIENPSIQSSSAPSKKTPTATSKSHKPPPATTPSNNGTLEKSESAALIPDFDDCDDDLFLWLLIIVICIDVILAIILILLIILAHRGSKKMKAVMTNKKMKDPKAAATSAKQGAADATATSPMATTLSKKEAKGKKMKPAEKEAKGKTTGGGKKSTDGKTTTFYTVDQTKYHTVDQTKFYTVDNTFDKSKKGKK